MSSLVAEIMRAHEAVKSGKPGARKRLERLQAQYRASGGPVTRYYDGEDAVQLAGARPARPRSIEREKSEALPHHRAPKRSTRTSQRPSWMLGENETWRLRQ